MAIVHVLGVNEEVARLNMLSEDVRPTAERLVREGADITVRETQKAAMTHGLRRTGQLIDSIGYDGVEVHSDSARIEVYPKGKRRGSKYTNALVGFVQDKGRRYGKRSRPGTGFFKEGQTWSENEVQEHWEQGWNEFLARRG